MTIMNAQLQIQQLKSENAELRTKIDNRITMEASLQEQLRMKEDDVRKKDVTIQEQQECIGKLQTLVTTLTYDKQELVQYKNTRIYQDEAEQLCFIDLSNTYADDNVDRNIAKCVRYKQQISESKIATRQKDRNICWLSYEKKQMTHLAYFGFGVAFILLFMLIVTSVEHKQCQESNSILFAKFSMRGNSGTTQQSAKQELVSPFASISRENILLSAKYDKCMQQHAARGHLCSSQFYRDMAVEAYVARAKQNNTIPWNYTSIRKWWYEMKDEARSKEQQVLTLMRQQETLNQTTNDLNMRNNQLLNENWQLKKNTSACQQELVQWIQSNNITQSQLNETKLLVVHLQQRVEEKNKQIELLEGNKVVSNHTCQAPSKVEESVHLHNFHQLVDSACNGFRANAHINIPSPLASNMEVVLEWDKVGGKKKLFGMHCQPVQAVGYKFQVCVYRELLGQLLVSVRLDDQALSTETIAGPLNFIWSAYMVVYNHYNNQYDTSTGVELVKEQKMSYNGILHEGFERQIGMDFARISCLRLYADNDTIKTVFHIRPAALSSV